MGRGEATLPHALGSLGLRRFLLRSGDSRRRASRPRRSSSSPHASWRCADQRGCTSLGTPRGNANIENLGFERGHHTLLIDRKGGKRAVIPLAPRTYRAVTLAIDERHSGPILLGRHGRLDRFEAYRIVRRIARRAGIPHKVHPHCLRHAFITNALDAGVPLRDVQEAASHSDPRTTSRYDRHRVSLDRHAAYSVAAFVAGATNGR